VAEGSVIYEARALQKHYAAVVALSDGNFQLREGELHVIVGDNGAGKSTMLKCLAGAVQPSGGQILLDGEPVTIHGPKAAAAMGLSTVFQDLALIDHLDAGSNMFLGREILYPPPLKWFGILNKRAMRKRAAAEVKRLRVGIRSVDQLVMGMSGGQRQAIAVARAVAFGTRIVLLDEPTAALGVRETAATLELIMELRAHGLSIVMISHNLPNVFEVADRITVLRLGRTVATVERRETDLTEVVSLMTGATTSAVADMEGAGV
jgi:fructose transport system ATP-binding protein